MFQRNQDIYASAPLRRLLDAQTHVLMSGLQRCPGAYGLMLNACDEPLPRVYPGLACWATLRVCGRVYQGDLWAAADESLPFIDESFALVVLRHALEVVPFAPAVLAEAVRTLAPGGLLAVTGVHPVSGWTPWLCWRMRGKIPALQWPLQLRYQLRQAGLDIERTCRVGRMWPGMPAAHTSHPAMLGGGFVLIARKHRTMVTPLRFKTLPARMSSNGHFSPSARRDIVL